MEILSEEKKTISQDIDVENRTQGLKNFLFSKKGKILLVVLGLVFLLWIAWQVRTANVPLLKDITTGDYTLGPDLDPFLFLRYSEIIIKNGSLPEIDTMRYVPNGFPTGYETVMLPQMMAYFYKIVLIFKPAATINYSGMIFPAVMFLLTVVAFWLLARKIFEGKKYSEIIAFIATLALIFSSSLLTRTIAGIPEKESVGFLFMFLGFYFFLYAYKAKSMRTAIITSFLAGISTVLMGLVWGGWILLITTISAATLIAFFLGKTGKKELVVYSIWLLSTIFLLSFLFQRYTLLGLIGSSSSSLAIFVLFLLLAEYALNHTALKNNPRIKKLEEKYSQKAVVFVSLIIIILVLSSLFLGINFIPNLIKNTAGDIINPYSERHALTVAENRQPYFDDWKGSYGPIINGQPILFWLFFLGSIVLSYQTFKGLGKRKALILVTAYALFIFSIVFSRVSPNSIMNGESAISTLFFAIGVLAVILSSGYVYYTSHKQKTTERFSNINFAYLFLMAYFVISLLGARGAIRLVMALDPIASLLFAYLAVVIFTKARENKEDTKKIIYLAIAAIVIVASIYALYYNYNLTSNQAKSFAPNVYTQQWQKAMSWVRTNTTSDSVFAHWWDYGYWVQSIGLRPTVLDGGNAVGYWNYLIARTVLTGKDEKIAQEFLYSHDVSYLLIDSTDIGKYPAYATLGSDQNYDRYSQISVFQIDERSTQEMKNETLLYFYGGFPLDQDFSYNDNTTTKIFPSGASGVGAVRLAIQGETVKRADAIFVYNNVQTTIPLKCVYQNNKTYNFDVNGYNGCLYIIPSVYNTANGLSINKWGAGIFLSERVKDTIFADLFLLDKPSTTFKLAHKEDDFFVRSLKDQKALGENQDFVFVGEIRGPIKIWEVNYSPDVKINPEYLRTDYPAEVRIATR